MGRTSDIFICQTSVFKFHLMARSQVSSEIVKSIFIMIKKEHLYIHLLSNNDLIIIIV